MDERWGTNGRSIALINNPRTLLEAPMATVTNLRETLNEIGATIDVEQDVVMVYLASHGSREHVLDVSMPPLELAPITAPALRVAARRLGHQVAHRRRVGLLLGRLHRCAEGRLHAGADGRRRPTARRSAAASDSDSTYFGEALFQQGLAQSESVLGAFDAAKERVAERETSGGFKPPSNPQLFVGPAMADKLKELDRGNAALRTGRSV